MSSSNERVEKITKTVELISKKWHPVIIHQLFDHGALRFNELETNIEGISAKVLTDSLNDLVDNELIDRIVISETPKQVEYELTEHGVELQAAMRSLAAWGDRFLDPDPDPTVLIVDDDPRLATMYENWLEGEFTVKKAYNGPDGLRNLTEVVRVVLIDRRMPGITGDEVIQRIKELGIDTRIVVVSALEPDFDIIDMWFDAYITKPGTKALLLETIEDVLSRETYSEQMQEYLALNAKRAVLEGKRSQSELSNNLEYQQLVSRLEQLERVVDDQPLDIESNEQLLAIIENG